MLKHATISRTSRAQHNTSTPSPQPPQLLMRSSSASSTSSSLSSSPIKSPFQQGRQYNSTPLSSAFNSPFSSPQKNGYQSQVPNNTPIKAKSDSMIKVFAQTLNVDVEYVTLHVNTQTQSIQVIERLLKKFRLKHRDPNLFYLTLERWIRNDGLKSKSVIALGDESCPLQLQQCCSEPPHNDIKFTLHMRPEASAKIYCPVVAPNVSSTISRPLVSNTNGVNPLTNRRRYNPAQLEEDLSKLDVKE